MVAGASHTPGTELLFDPRDRSSPEALAAKSKLQHRKHGDKSLILQPQPSIVDRNDPLSWSSRAKLMTYFNALFYAFDGSMLGPLMSAGFLGLATLYKRPLSDISQFNGSILITQGLGNIIWGPCAVKFGRRPVYLLSNLGQMMTCVWCAIAVKKGYIDTLIGRIFQGLFQAPVEALTPTTIGDIFFLHERGSKISIYGFSVLGGNNIGPIVSAGLIQATGGVSWSFWLMTILCGINLVLMIFFMPETKFTGERPSVNEILDMADVLATHKESDAALSEFTHTPAQTTNEAAVTEKRSNLRRLVPWSGNDRNVSWGKVFCRPFVLALYPTVLYGSAIYGITLGWHVIFGVTVSQVFNATYGFDSIQQGLVYIGLAIGQIFGVLLSGPFSDWIANYFSKRNDGVREPEMRLPTIAIGAVLTIVGSLVYAGCISRHTHWIGPVIGLAIQSAGCQTGANIAVTYSVDSHLEMSAELMVTIASIKSLIAWIFTWVSNDWITSQGILQMYGILSAVTGVLFLTTIPLYYYGKRIRAWLHKQNWMHKLNLED